MEYEYIDDGEEGGVDEIEVCEWKEEWVEEGYEQVFYKDCWEEWVDDPPVITINPNGNSTIALGQSITYSSTATAGNYILESGPHGLATHSIDWRIVEQGQYPNDGWVSGFTDVTSPGSLSLGAFTNGAPRGITASPGQSTHSVTLTPTQPGAYSVRFHVIDQSSIQTKTPARTLTVANVLPVVSIDLPIGIHPGQALPIQLLISNTTGLDHYLISYQIDERRTAADGTVYQNWTTLVSQTGLSGTQAHTWSGTASPVTQKGTIHYLVRTGNQWLPAASNGGQIYPVNVVGLEDLGSNDIPFVLTQNTLELLTTGSIYGNMPLDIKATVTPPSGIGDYSFKVRVQRWQGAVSAQPLLDGWTTVHETPTPVSDEYVWRDSAQPQAGGPCKIIYRLYSWLDGTQEWANYVDREIIVQNSSPNGSGITLSAYTIDYGQNVTVTGLLNDSDGNLTGHSLWVIAPTATGEKNPNWDCYSRTLNPDWWGDSRISETGWSGTWNNGQPSNGYASTVSGVFKPNRLGVWQLHTNGCDAYGAWGPGDTKDLTVVKATPIPVASGTFSDREMNAYIPIPQGYLDAAFRNPHDNQSLPTSGITYTLTMDDIPVSLDEALEPGEYELCATYPGDENHTAASHVVLLTVSSSPNANDDGDPVPNAIEARLGTSSNNTGVMDTTNALGIKILTPISTED
jgi:hypothetical protein